MTSSSGPSAHANSATKSIISGILSSNPNQATIKSLCLEYESFVGARIPFRDMGFSNIEDYLRSIPDTVQVSGTGPMALVRAALKKESVHIRALVCGQKKTPRRNSRCISYFQPRNFRPRYGPSQGQYRPPPPHNYPVYNSPRIQPPKKTVSFVPAGGERRYGQQSEEFYIIDDITDVPEIPIGMSQPEVPLSDTINETLSLTQSSVNEMNEEEDDDKDSNIPFQVRKRLKDLMAEFPEGLYLTRLPQEYKKKYGRGLHYEKYSFKSLIEMIIEMPKTVHFAQTSSDDYLLFDISIPIPKVHLTGPPTPYFVREIGELGTDIDEMTWDNAKYYIPNDVVHHGELLARFFPDDYKVGDYLDIKIADIYDPSKLWVYMTYGDLEPLMDNLLNHFQCEENRILIPPNLQVECLYCVCTYCDLYHRAAIVNLLPSCPDFVRVLFVDYGTIENVPVDKVWFLPRKFADVSCQSIRASLSHIQPPGKNEPWSLDAINRFRSLTRNRVLVGEITSIDFDDMIFYIYLADISNQNNISYINDTLVKEKHAIYIDKVQKDQEIELHCKPKIPDLHLVPTFQELEAGDGLTADEMYYMHKMSLHNYLPQYFETDTLIPPNRDYLSSNISNPSTIKDLTDYFLESDKDLQERFDNSWFPHELWGDIREQIDDDNSDKSTPSVQSTPDLEPTVEVTQGDSILKKRMSTLLAIGDKCADEQKIVNSDNLFSDTDTKLDYSTTKFPDDVKPENSLLNLPNTSFEDDDSSIVTRRKADLLNMEPKLNNWNIFDSDTSPKFSSTNPFLTHVNNLKVSTNPFLSPEPSLSPELNLNLERLSITSEDSSEEVKVSKSDFFEMFGKNLDNGNKIVNVLNDPNSTTGSQNKTCLADSNSSLDKKSCVDSSVQTEGSVVPRGDIRAPPGFTPIINRNVNMRPQHQMARQNMTQWVMGVSLMQNPYYQQMAPPVPNFWATQSMNSPNPMLNNPYLSNMTQNNNFLNPNVPPFFPSVHYPNRNPNM